jgi:3-dehydroquinate dehydratase type I
LETRVVFHIDFDYFYAQCEEIRSPDLRSKPVCVCVFSDRGKDTGAIATANYIARKYGANGVEARMDFLEDSILDHNVWRYIYRYRKNIIVTLRDSKYGGNRSFSLDEVMYVFNKSLEYGSILDLDIDNVKKILEKISSIESARRILIPSIHTWSVKDTLSLVENIDSVISTIIKNSRSNIILGLKIAFYIDNLDNKILESMIKTLYRLKRSNVAPIILPMGPQTPILRIMFYLLGSKILYTSLDNKHKLAPGQLEISRAIDLLKLLDNSGNS